jgi:hypothetical protein
MIIIDPLEIFSDIQLLVIDSLAIFQQYTPATSFCIYAYQMMAAKETKLQISSSAISKIELGS